MNATVVLGISIAVAATLLLALALIVRRAAHGGAHLPLDAHWIDELSIERYRPMIRLLDERDLEFIRSLPGFTPRMAIHFREERCRIFRAYLEIMEGDFARVCTAVKVLMLQSQFDRPDLASELLRLQATFALADSLIRARLLLYRFGIGRVDVSVLVRTFDSMRLELQSLVPATAGACA